MRKSLSFYGRDRGPMGCAEGARLGFTKHCPNELRGHMDAELCSAASPADRVCPVKARRQRPAYGTIDCLCRRSCRRYDEFDLMR